MRYISFSEHVGSIYFFALSDKTIVGGRRFAVATLLRCFAVSFLFVSCSLLLVTTAIEKLRIVEPHCTLLQFDTRLLQSFSILLSERVS